MRMAAAALLALLLTISPPGASQDTLYESSLGPNGGAPYHRTRAQLEAMGGVWTGERFTTRDAFANTNDPSAATFAAPVIYTPVLNRTPKTTERKIAPL